MYRKYIKRPLDFICGALALIVFCWLYLIIAILAWVKLGRPIVFVQERPGKDGKIFKLYKFKSMSDKRDVNGELLPDSERLSKFGRRLRNWSLDEILSAINLIRGDISVVGPRPLLVRYLPLYSEWQKRRHEVRPGLTGLAQVSGRNAISWEEKFELDVQYVERITFLGDLKIVALTVLKAIRHEGINADVNVTMTPFEGIMARAEECVDA